VVYITFACELSILSEMCRHFSQSLNSNTGLVQCLSTSLHLFNCNITIRTLGNHDNKKRIVKQVKNLSISTAYGSINIPSSHRILCRVCGQNHSKERILKFKHSPEMIP
jgi:hypothetical protein